MAIYDNVLSASQVEEHYALGSGYGQVDIELMEQGNPTPVLTLADDTANDGQFIWTIPDTVPPGANYLVRITRGNDPAFSDTSNQPFEITEPIARYYVNVPGDTDFGDNEYTTAPGDDGNDGLSPGSPKASVRAVLEAYDLGPGSVILVDTGTYNLSTNILLETEDSGASIRGPILAGHAAVLDRGNNSAGSYGVELAGADDVTVEHLHLTGGNCGVYASASADSDQLTVSGCEIYGNSSTGVYLESSNDNAVVSNNVVYSQPYGIICVWGADVVIAGNTVRDSSVGISIQNAGSSSCQWQRGLQ